MYCGSCGRQFSDNASFCPECGTPVKKKTGMCPVCRQETRPGVEFCGNCGAALAAGQAPVDGGSREAPASDRPKLTWKSLCKLILVNWKNSLLRGIPLMLVVFCLSMVVHTFLLVYYNEGFGQGTWLGKQALATQGNTVSATVLWTLVSGFIFATIPAMRKKGFAGIADLFRLPGKTVKYLRECGPDGFQMFLTGIGLTLVISSIMSGMTSLTLAIGIAAIFAMPLGRILAILIRSFWMTLLQALRPEQAVNIARFGVIPAYLLIIGTAAGFALGTVLPMTILFGLAALAAVVVMIFARKTPPGTVTQVLLFLSAIGYVILYAKGAAAHDGGWLEGGGTWESWVRSQGAGQAVLQGLGPSMGAAVGPALVAAASSVGPDDFKDDDKPAEDIDTPPMPPNEDTEPEGEPEPGPDSDGQVEYDQDGYDSEGYDKDGYNRDGYDKDGYDKNGFDKDGYNRDGYDKDGYDKNGFDKDGYNRDGYDKDGYDKNGFDKDGYNRDGYDKDGYDKNGFDKDGYNRDGYDKDGYDKNGFDKDGYNRDGYDKDGFDRNGFDRERFDRDGYGLEGYNREGFNRDGNDMWGCGRDGYDKDGYDREGYNRQGYNRWGFNREGRNPYGMTKDQVKEQIRQRMQEWQDNNRRWTDLADRAGWFEGFYGWVKWGADQGVDFLSYLTGPVGQKVKHTYHFTKHLGGGLGEAMGEGDNPLELNNTGDHLARGAGKGAVDAALRYLWDSKAVKWLTKSTGGKVPGLYDYSRNPLSPGTKISQLWANSDLIDSTVAKITRDRFWDAAKNLIQKDIRNYFTKDPVKNWINRQIGN